MDTTDIWQTFKHRVYHFILKKVNDPTISEDLLQDVFIKVHQQLPTIRNNDKLVAWLFQIVRFTIADYYRKYYKEKEQQQSVLNIDDATSKVDFSLCLKPFVLQLKATHRQALEAVYFGGMSQKEYAEKEAIPYSTAKSRVQKAKTALRALFESCCSPIVDSYGNLLDSNENCICNQAAA